MTASYPIRPASPSELAAFVGVGSHAFNSSWPMDEIVALDRLVAEPERTLAAFDGDQMVGTALAYSYTMTVPGSEVRAAGVSGVSVLPSHRRRGILSALMNRQIADIRENHEPVAALFASEAAIYGRFGYGAAAAEQTFVIRRGEGRARTAAHAAAGGTARGTMPAGGTRDAGEPPALRLADPGEATADLAAVYEAVRASRPGMMARTAPWWQLALADPEFMRDGRSPLRCVIAEDGSGPRGYALYSARPSWDPDGVAAHTLFVRELFGADPAACAALWADLLTRDLVAEVHAGMRPADDPLPHLLADPRLVRSRISDGLWIRLTDVPAALRARRYASPVDMVIEVTDHLLAANDGRWRLRAGGLADQSEPTCEPTRAAADVALPVSALGAAYLGGTRLGALAAAGLVSELRPGAVAGLSAAMWWDPAPWSPIMF